MPNRVQNEIIFENASGEKAPMLIRELKLAAERALVLDVWGYTKGDFDEDEYDEEGLNDEETEVEPPEIVDIGLSISDLI